MKIDIMNKEQLIKDGFKQLVLLEKPTCYYINKDGKLVSLRNEIYKEIKPFLSNKGYFMVSLTISFGLRKSFLLHRLIAISFIDNVDNFNIVNHINGITTDNSIDNLEWCTQSYNCIHSYKIGTHVISDEQKKKLSELYSGKTGKDCRFSKKIIDLKTNTIFDSLLDAAKSINMKHSTLCAMLKGQNPNKTNFKYYG